MPSNSSLAIRSQPAPPPSPLLHYICAESVIGSLESPIKLILFSPLLVFYLSVCLPLPTLLFPNPANPEFPSVLHICVIPSLLFLPLFLDLYRRVQPDSLKTSTQGRQKATSAGFILSESYKQFCSSLCLHFFLSSLGI